MWRADGGFGVRMFINERFTAGFYSTQGAISTCQGYFETNRQVFEVSQILFVPPDLEEVETRIA